MFGFRPRAGRRLRRAAAFAMLTGLFVTTVGYAASSAQNLTSGSVGGFEDDGNMAQDNAAPSLDWATPSVATNAVKVTDDLLDSGYSGTSKENSPSGFVCNNGGANPGKNDILRAYVNTRIYGPPTANPPTAYLDMAYVRADGTGDAHVNFEFNQHEITNPCPYTGRTAGDILITYDFPGGNSAATVETFHWDPTSNTDNDGDGDWVPFDLPAGAAAGASNPSAITDPLSGNAAIGAREFGEATVDLVSLNNALGGGILDCPGFGFVNIRSRSSGESFNSALQDRLPQTPVDVSTCGSVKIKKVDDAGNPLAGAVFGLFDNAQASGAAKYQCTSDASGICDFTSVTPGDYWIKEISAPTGYAPDTSIRPVTVGFRQAVDLTSTPFVDARDTGFVRIHKVLHDQDGNTITPPAGSLNGTTFLMYQDANSNGSYDAGEEAHLWPNGPVATCALASGSTSCDIGPLATGAYRVTETVVPPNSSPAGDVNVTVTKGTAQVPIGVNFVNILAPINIHLDKAGPDTANIGDVITYTFDVTTTGPRLHNIVLAELVNVCSSAPQFVSGDTNSNGFLELGETWHYTCQHTITLADPDPLTNTAKVTGTDDYGRNVESTDSHVVDILHPDVSVVKDAVQTPISAGSTAAFTITVNVGGDAGSIARGVTLSDPLPAGLTWSDNSNDCSVSAGTLSCSFGDLAFGASRVVTVSATTSAANCGDLVNTASVSATNELDSARGNNSDGATIHVSCPDVSVLKTTDTPVINAGDAAHFTIVVTNNDATGTATNVTLNDPLPGGVTWSEDSPDCSITAGTLTCAFGDLGPSATRTIHITGTPSPSACGTLVNTATVSSTNEGAGLQGNNSSTATITVQCPDVSVLKTADASPITAGDNAAFTIVVSSNGPGVARSVTLNDPLPAGVTWSDDSADCTVAGGSLTCAFGDLASGQTRTIHVSGVTDPPDCGTLTNTATVASTNEPSSALANNTSTASIVVQCPDLTLTKVADASPVSAGDPVGFLITIHNNGPGLARSVAIADPLPSSAGLGWTIESTTAAPGQCTIAAGALQCALGDMASGATVVVHIVSPTTAATCGDFTNTATGTATNDEPVTSGASITVLCPGLNFTKSPDGGLVEAGQDVVFTLTVSNTGPGDAHDVVVDDPLPNNLTWTVDDNRCTITASNLHCVLGTLAAPTAGQTATVIAIHVSAHTTAADCGVVNNTGTASSSNAPTLTDDGQVRVRCPIAITVDKTGPTLAHVGDTITYTMVVTNTGGENLVSVALTDPVCTAGTITITNQGDGDSVLAVGEAWTYTCQHTVTAADADPLPNTATVLGTDADGRTTTDVGDHVVDIIHPAIAIVKTANPTSAEPGQTVTFTFVVTNTGDTTLSNVTVVDDVLGSIGTIPSLAPNQSTTLTKTMTVAANSPTRNVGTATGADTLGKSVTASDDATLTIVLPEVIERAPLPRTGQESGPLVAFGLSLIVGGGLVLMIPGTTRRRREGEA